MSGDGLLIQEQPRMFGSSAFATGPLDSRDASANYHPHIPSNHILPPPPPGVNKRKRISKSNVIGIGSSDFKHNNDNRNSNPSTSNSNSHVSHTHKRAKTLKTSSSTPQLHSSGNANSSNFLSSPDNRKRNKLGYHRTSVACGHCRRRKIRCFPSKDDTSGRCENCIRLKKECTFYPVDQSSAQKSSSADRPTKRPIQDSSVPGTGQRSAANTVHTNNYSHHPTIARAQEYTFSSTPQSGVGIYPTSQAASEGTTASFAPSIYDRSPIWDNPAFQNPSMSSTLSQSVDFQISSTWKPDPHTYSSQYIRPYSNYATSTTLSTPHETYVTSSGNDMVWTNGPQRTMSMNQMDEKLPSDATSSSHQSLVPRRSATLPHPPHRHTSEQSTATSISEPTPGPAITTSQSQMHSYAYPSPWPPSYSDNQQHFTEPRICDEHPHVYDAPWY